MSDSKETVVKWPMSNIEIKDWFCRKNIPIEELVGIWIRMDQNEITRGEIAQLGGESNSKELENRLRHRIQFGLRGRMEAGFSRMNDLTVIQASQGLAEYVLRNIKDAKSKGVVLGRDHRHHSDTFMRLSAAAFLKRGFRVYYFKDHLNHTPLVPYGIKKLGAACGVMITASHNPADDNGYKVYWENGCQILSPHDTGIQEEIMANLVPISWDTRAIETNPLVIDVSERLFPQYVKDVVQLGGSIVGNTPKFVYTPMHGVGLKIFEQVIQSIGFQGSMYPVPKQALPDPNFPTVKFPNPEEKGSPFTNSLIAGALDMAIALANEKNISLVLANDPDADRFCAAERTHDNRWYIFSGNEMGIILAYHVFNQCRGRPHFDIARLAMLSSSVSSKMLQSMAMIEGFHHEETLTGFKWMGNKSLDLVAQGYYAPYAFEEAIGYMFGDIVRDKDGIAAAIVFLSLVAEIYGRDQTINQLLIQLYEKYGHFASQNSYVICEDPRLMTNVFHKLRHKTSTISYIQRLGRYKITKVKDISLGYDSSKDSIPQDKPIEPSAEMITFELEDSTVMTLRGSGTEPKLKYYIESEGNSMAKARSNAEGVEKALLDLFQTLGLK